MGIRRGVRKGVGALALFAAIGVPHPAAASQDCGYYSVTAPVAGTNSDTKCPVTNPPPFTMRNVVGDCESVPPAGARVCVVVTVYTPV
jgi:hypothetical protein